MDVVLHVDGTNNLLLSYSDGFEDDIVCLEYNSWGLNILKLVLALGENE